MYAKHCLVFGVCMYTDRQTGVVMRISAFLLALDAHSKKVQEEEEAAASFLIIITFVSIWKVVFSSALIKANR